ncbi:MAG: type II toxin-antitoxin system MqsA family antitoxin [Candidatus Marinimicrobia bacterium]|jgi:YgiT-type zinc finger domain-containing protein|nr:type II toxin-antitoxin system MqsA family antitoxin [Candidatus Neomarinimicrobiota bacterium]
MKSTTDTCPLCGGKKTQGVTTFTVDMKNTLVVIRSVPATLCSLCGNEWLTDEIAARVEKLVVEAKNNHHMVEVSEYREVA